MKYSNYLGNKYFIRSTTQAEKREKKLEKSRVVEFLKSIKIILTHIFLSIYHTFFTGKKNNI